MLVAISIPIFTSRLESAREATDLANIRNAYADAETTALADGTSGSASVKINQTTSGWTGGNNSAQIGSTSVSGHSALGDVVKGDTVVVTVDPDDGTATFSK